MAEKTDKLVCTDEEFFKAWQGAESLEKVKEALNAPNVQSCSIKAAFYKKKGIPLKDFPKKATPTKKEFDVEKALASFAKVTGQKLTMVKKEGVEVKKAAEAKAAEAKKKAAESAAKKTAKAANLTLAAEVTA